MSETQFLFYIISENNLVSEIMKLLCQKLGGFAVAQLQLSK
jgi:hypothetical protein